MTNPQFVERLYPSIGLLAAYSLSFPMVLLAAAPFGWSLALVLAGFSTIVLIAISVLSSPLVVIDEFRVMAGSVALPREVIGEFKVISQSDLRDELGPKLSARAALVIRGDIRSAVRIEIADPEDPTPYLIVSSRRAEELVSALRTN